MITEQLRTFFHMRTTPQHFLVEISQYHHKSSLKTHQQEVAEENKNTPSMPPAKHKRNKYILSKKKKKGQQMLKDVAKLFWHYTNQFQKCLSNCISLCCPLKDRHLLQSKNPAPNLKTPETLNFTAAKVLITLMAKHQNQLGLKNRIKINEEHRLFLHRKIRTNPSEDTAHKSPLLHRHARRWISATSSTREQKQNKRSD